MQRSYVFGFGHRSATLAKFDVLFLSLVNSFALEGYHQFGSDSSVSVLYNNWHSKLSDSNRKLQAIFLLTSIYLSSLSTLPQTSFVPYDIQTILPPIWQHH